MEDFSKAEIIASVVIIIYILLMFIVGFISMGVDKAKAKKSKWRIKESTLLIIAALGGSLGSLMGMRCFRHKTKHIKFVVLVPIFLVVHFAVLIYVAWRFII